MLFQHLKTFVRVVDAGGLTRAAEQLRLTQPAVTKQLRMLEETFGTQLLHRKTRRVTATASGELVYHYARRILALVDEAVEAVTELEQPGRGEIIVGAVSTVALFGLPPVLAAFAKSFPLVRVRVKIAEIQENLDGLLRGELALAIMTVPIVHPQLTSIPLFTDVVRLVASPLRAKTLSLPLTLTDLARLEFISYTTPSRFRTLVDGALEQQGVIPHVSMEFNDHDAVKGMVKAGLGVAMVPDSVAREDIQRGELVILPVAGLPAIERTTSLVFSHEHPNTQVFHAFVETLLAHFMVDAQYRPQWPTGPV